MPAQSAPATNPGSAQSPAPSLPFPIASRMMSRFSFTTGAIAMSAAAPTPVSPIQIPAVGYIRHIDLQVTFTGVGGTAPAFTADAPFNGLAAVEFRTAAGNDLIVPLTGYQLYLACKYGAQYAAAPMSDNRLGAGYTTVAGPPPTSTFFLQVPLEIDCETGLGAIPALASNRSYQLAITLAAIATLVSGAPTSMTATIQGTAWYWSEPPAVTQSGVAQETQPYGLGTISQWQLETPPLTPGDKYVKSNNVGNVIRTMIFVLRNSSGARIDASGWPSVSELYLDNEPMFYLTQAEWIDEFVQKTFMFYGATTTTGATKDVPNAADTGVYPIPFHALAGGIAGDPANSRSQLLPTLDASQLQLRGTSFGANVSTLEILTQSVVPTSSSVVFSK